MKNVLSLDIETFGSCLKDGHGRDLPPQTHWHPARCLHQDKPASLVLTVAVTRADADLNPLQTTLFDMWKDDHRSLLARWIRWADTLVGANLKFDILWLRHYLDFRPLLDGRHLLLDSNILSFSENEARPEKSLKTIGPVVGLPSRKGPTLANNQRFRDPTDPLFRRYNADDTTDALAQARTCMDRIRSLYPNTPKLSPYALRYWSDCTYLAVHFEETGIRFNRARLERLERILQHRTAALVAKCPIILSGKGSDLSKRKALADIMPFLPDTSLAHLTDGGKMEASDFNRNLMKPFAPDPEPIRQWSAFSSMDKLLSSYTFPLLRHRRRKPHTERSRLIPRTFPVLYGQKPHISPSSDMAYPTIYILPGPERDDVGDSGGQIQGRFSFKHPSANTFPSIITRCIESRRPGGMVTSMDLSQVEPCGAALWSGDPDMILAICNGEDLHVRRILLIESAESLIAKYGPNFLRHPGFRHVERQLGKVSNLSDQYLSGAGAMRDTCIKRHGLVKPLSFFQRIVNRRHIDRPHFWAWQQRLIEAARSTGYIEIPFTGHTRRFLRNNDEEISEMVNFPIQCSCAVAMRCLLFKLLELLKDEPCDMFLEVHDSAYFDHMPSYLPTLRRIIAEAVAWLTTDGFWGMLCRHFGNDVPLRYEIT